MSAPVATAAPESAAEFYARTQRIVAAAVVALRSRLPIFRASAIDATFAALLPDLVTVLAAMQILAARNAGAYLPQVLTELGLDAPAVADVVPSAFVGASSGVPLETLFGTVPEQARMWAGEGVDYSTIESRAGSLLEGIFETQLADTSRAATSVGVAARPALTGYVRMVSADACGRCLVLAGKFYRYNADFLRHPRCFPEGVIASGPALEGATRRWFEGELVVLATASGQNLSLTGNHPVLTSRGWLPANLLQEGDEVVRSTDPEGAHALVVPDHDQMPARVEDVWRSLSVAGLHSVESSPKDFHGDGQHGQVDVVGPNGSLNYGALVSLLEHLAEHCFSGRSGASLPFNRQGAAELLDLGYASSSRRPVRGGGPELALLGRRLRSGYQAGGALVAPFDASLAKLLADEGAGHSVLLREPVLTGAGFVGASDLGRGQVPVKPRWDAPGDSFSVQTSEGYARLGRDLLNRLSGQVELDRVVELRRVHWRGHVYSLSSSEGWHAANNLIVSNCHCYGVPATRESARGMTFSPEEAFSGMSPTQQDRSFGKANAQAIRDGADVSRVVNATGRASGMTSTVSGVKVTSEAAANGGLRLVPESVYRLAGDDRDLAIKLLAKYGYLN